jgi:hypothetical protein
MAFTLSNYRLNGCLFAPPSPKDYKTIFDEDVQVPDRMDLREFCTTVEDQGQIGSCTANAAVGALEYHYKRRDGRAADLSRMFVYFNTRRMRGQLFDDCGAQIREAMASIMAFGACREEVWPYNPALFAQEPPREAYNDAWARDALQYARVDGTRGAVRAVAKGLPVVFGCGIPERCYAEAERTGVMPELRPGELEQGTAGGHSMLIVGYDNNRQSLLVRNSWGESWGERGYVWIPYSVLDATSSPSEYWVMSELEKNTGFQLVRPGRTPAKDWDDEDDDYGKRGKGAAQPSGIIGSTSKMRDQIRAGLEADLASSTRKIDSLLRGANGPAPGARSTAVTLPCTACAGSGICPFCHGKKPGCVRCTGSGACAECHGTGVL